MADKPSFATLVSSYRFESPTKSPTRIAETGIIEITDEQVTTTRSLRSLRTRKRKVPVTDVVQSDNDSGKDESDDYTEPETGTGTDEHEFDFENSPPRKRRRLISSPTKATTSTGKQKKTRKNQGYLPPSAFAHLGHLDDRLKHGLDILFCGINPGTTSAKMGLHFAKPGNAFWRCLYKSGLTSTLLPPQAGPQLTKDYNYGLTDLVQRPSTASSNLSPQEMLANVPSLLIKIATYRPRIVAFVGFVIWDRILERLIATAEADTTFTKEFDTLGSSIGVNKDEGGVKGPMKDVQVLKAPVGWDALITTVKNKRVKKGTKAENRPAEFVPWKIVYPDATGAEDVKETLFFPLPSTSGLNTAYKDKHLFFAGIKDALPEIKARTFDTSQLRSIIVNVPPVEKSTGAKSLPVVIEQVQRGGAVTSPYFS